MSRQIFFFHTTETVSNAGLYSANVSAHDSADAWVAIVVEDLGFELADRSGSGSHNVSSPSRTTSSHLRALTDDFRQFDD